MPLHPVPRLWLRVLLLALILLPIPFARATWTVKGMGVLLWTVMLGSYRDVRIEGAVLRYGFVVGFVPLKPRRLKLDRVTRLAIDTEQGVGWGWMFVVGLWNWLFCWVLDWLFPWFGGRYRVWLLTARGKQILAWQGNSDDALHENLAMLESATGLTTERSGFPP
jgi:hypothetical protein